MDKPDNEIQLIDQMEILRTARPLNEVDYIDEIQILKEEKPANEIEKIDRIELKSQQEAPKVKEPQVFNLEERDSIEILSEPLMPLQKEYVDELKIKGITKPENEIQ